jgi:hypothetical protein
MLTYPVIPVDIGIQTRRGSRDSSQAMRQAIRSLDDSIPSEAIHSLHSEVAGMRAYPRFRAFIVIFLALAALVITAAGLQGTLHQIVSRRIPEFGLRRALGAQTGDLLWIVVGQGAMPVLAGVLAGVTALPALARLLVLLRRTLFSTAGGPHWLIVVGDTETLNIFLGWKPVGTRSESTITGNTPDSDRRAYGYSGPVRLPESHLTLLPQIAYCSHGASLVLLSAHSSFWRP